MGTQPKRVVIVDDHPIVRQGIAAVLSRHESLIVIGEASDAKSGYDLIRAEMPDIAIIDIALPGLSGLELVGHLTKVVPEVPILVMSMFHPDDYADRVMASGARGYLMKQVASEKLVLAIEIILSGKYYLPTREHVPIARHETSNALVNVKLKELTNLELEVLKFLGQGLSTKSIAGLIHKSPKSVEIYRSHIRAKLGLATANELIIFAARLSSDGDK